MVGPYRDGRGEYHVAENVRRAREVALYLMGLGFAVHCPHANTDRMGGALGDEVFLENSLAILYRSDAIYVLDGWRSSDGSVVEVSAALELGIPVFYEGKGRTERLLRFLRDAPEPDLFAEVK